MWKTFTSPARHKFQSLTLLSRSWPISCKNPAVSQIITLILAIYVELWHYLKKKNGLIPENSWKIPFWQSLAVGVACWSMKDCSKLLIITILNQPALDCLVKALWGHHWTNLLLLFCFLFFFFCWYLFIFCCIFVVVVCCFMYCSM